MTLGNVIYIEVIDSEMFASYYQKNSLAEKLELEKALTDAVEKHKKELTELMQKHQKGLADAVTIHLQEQTHRERLEIQLANQKQELDLCERLEKGLLDDAQSQQQRKEVEPLSFSHRKTFPRCLAGEILFIVQWTYIRMM